MIQQSSGLAANSATVGGIAAMTARPARLTPLRWLICAVAALGFAFDLYEIVVLPLVLRPALAALGNLESGTPEFNRWAGLFFFVPAAVGGGFGLLGGYLTDLFGRRRVLVWSILLYGFSACAASYSSTLPEFLILRCTTLIGVCVEYVAAVAWLAELFADPKQRDSVLGYTQGAAGLGGLLGTGAYYLAVTYAERFPVIHAGHEAWRYTLLSGLIPAIPLMIIPNTSPTVRLRVNVWSLATVPSGTVGGCGRGPTKRTSMNVSLGAEGPAFEWLDRAHDDHSTLLTWIKTDPRFDSVRDDPRCRDLLRRMRLLE